jgi:hypothetical protein
VGWEAFLLLGLRPMALRLLHVREAPDRRGEEGGETMITNREAAIAALIEFWKLCRDASWDGSDINGRKIQKWAEELGLLRIEFVDTGLAEAARAVTI